MFIIGGYVYEDEEILGNVNTDIQTPVDLDYSDDVDNLAMMFENKLKF